MRKVAQIRTNTSEFKFSFNREIIDRIKGMQGRKYNPTNKSWEVTIDYRNCFETHRIINEYDFTSDQKTLACIAEMKQMAKDFVQGRTRKVEELEVPKSVHATLRPYQVEGFSSMVHWKQCINGCEMGLGKTLQSLVAVEYQKSFPCLVIVPASLKYNWENEINKFLPDRKSVVIDSKTIFYNDCDFYIINYDIVKKRKKDLERIQFKSIVCDESHKLKNKKAQRTKAVKELADKISIRYLLSGTPIENRPSELISQLDIINRLNDLGGYWEFVNKYCGATKGAFGLDISGATNLDDLYFKASNAFYFRRNKNDVLKDLPDKIYSTVYFELDNYKDYRMAERNLVAYLKGQVKSKKEVQKMLEVMDEEDRETFLKIKEMQAENTVNSAEHLVLMTTLRKITGYGKIKAAKEWIDDFFENNPKEKLLVFAWHTEIVKQLSEHLGWDVIYGGVDVKKRQQYVDKFQNDDEVKGMVLNIQAGGVGLNLTAASNVLFIEEPYNPSLKLQAEDRAHRIGQKDTVNVYTALARETIDIDVNNIVNEKLIVTKAVNAGDFSGIGQESDVTKELMNILKKK